MISSKRLAQMARKCLRAATAAGRKRIALQKGNSTNAMAVDSEARGAAPVSGKGHYVVYSNDGQRFEVPLAFLKSEIFGELLTMSEDVFGLTSDGPITLPCDAAFVGSVVSCLQRKSSRVAERALLASMAARRCLVSLAPCPLLQINQPLVVCGY